MTTTEISDPARVQQDWQDWHEARERDLAVDFGWLTPVALHWLPTALAPIGDLPGEFGPTRGGAGFRARPADGWTLVASGAPVDGVVTADVAEGESLLWLARGGVRIELLRRGGRVGLRVRDNEAVARTGFTGVPAYDVDPSWVLQGRFEATEPQLVTVDTAQPELHQQVAAIGTLEIEIGGVAHRLVLTGGPHRAGLVFHDPTNGTDTAAWRSVAVTLADNGRAVVDFNRTVNLPFAFGPAGTCPAPVAGNTITVPVTAGERRPAVPGR